MNGTDQQAKDPLTLALCSVLLLGTALVFAAIGDAPQTLWFTAAGLGLSFILRRPLARTSRTYVYSGVTVIALVVVQNQFFSIETDRFVLLPAELYCPTLIFVGVVLTFFDQRETTVAAIIGTCLLGMMVAGNTFGTIAPNARFTAANVALSNLHLFYASVVVVQLSALLPLVGRALHRHQQQHAVTRYRVRRAVIVITALVLVLSGGVGLRRAVFANADRLQFLFRRMIQNYAFSRMRHVLFPQNTDLWRTVSPDVATDMTVVVHAEAARAPGYLRGRAYDFYESGQWSAIGKGEAKPLSVALPEGQLTAMRYYRPGNERKQEGPPALEVYPTGTFLDDILLAPGETRAVTIIADDVESDINGTLIARGWETNGGYSLETGDYDFASSYNRPDAAHVSGDRYTFVPPALEARLKAIGDAVFAGRQNATAQEKLNQLGGYFSREYSYALGQKVRSGVDPVLQFLEETRKGHCELFATAAALILRTEGIATRYVTGFVCTEQHPLGGHWIARMRDAHAWIEVYMPGQQRWQLVEFTPASGVPGDRPGLNWFAAVIDQASIMWKMLLAHVKRGHVAEAVISTAGLTGRFLWRTVANPLRGTVTALTIILGTSLLVILRRRGRETQTTQLPVTIRRLQKGLQRVEKHAAHYGIRRHPSQTIQEFAETIRVEQSLPHRDILLDILKEYQTLRYQGDAPSKDVSRTFCKRVKRGLT